ncbi:hypothetical protein A9Q99_12165 [Gammaproteobacteria bacterium 45_16_T64]|nr:hypothetical protein A9Q99_12165 [Gammaproteobacteria bacterium 45_16_T64]
MEQFSQQVNFYRDEFKKTVVFLSSVQIMAIVGALSFVFVVLSIAQLSMMSSLKESAQIAFEQKAKMREQLDSIEANFVEPTEDPNILAEMNRMDVTIVEKKKLVDFLGGQSDKKNFSFSTVMDSLAKKNIGGIWLTKLIIKTEGNQYRLVGNTQHPDLIPKYIDQLKTSDVLVGTSFGLFDLERPEKGEGYLKFVLSSEGIVGGSEVTSR